MGIIEKIEDYLEGDSIIKDFLRIFFIIWVIGQLVIVFLVEQTTGDMRKLLGVALIIFGIAYFVIFWTLKKTLDRDDQRFG